MNSASRKALLSISLAGMCVVCFLLGRWYSLRFRNAHLVVSEIYSCDVKRSWGSCEVICSMSGAPIGTLVLRDELFSQAVAIVPGMTGNTIVCLLELDTTYCAFVVELTSTRNKEQALPERFQEACISSSFICRPCLQREVEGAVTLLKTVGATDLRSYVLFESESIQRLRSSVSDLLLLATQRHKASDPFFKNAKPHILAEN